MFIPSHFQVVSEDLFNIRSKANENITHLQYVMGWLKYAQDINKQRGISAGYAYKGAIKVRHT